MDPWKLAEAREPPRIRKFFKHSRTLKTSRLKNMPIFMFFKSIGNYHFPSIALYIQRGVYCSAVLSCVRGACCQALEGSTGDEEDEPTVGSKQSEHGPVHFRICTFEGAINT
jgi:hypothetical protein